MALISFAAAVKLPRIGADATGAFVGGIDVLMVLVLVILLPYSYIIIVK